MAQSGSPDPGLTSHTEDDYVSSEDEDFDPTNGANEAKEDLSSESDDEAIASTIKACRVGSPKRGDNNGHVEDLGFENSGDEATIRKGRKRRRKHGEGEEDESGGEGGFVKTRTMRAAEEKEKKPLANVDGATIDVDALWVNMNSKEARPNDQSSSKETFHDNAAPTPTKLDEPAVQDVNRVNTSPHFPDASHHEDMITINRTYVFAGETVTEEKIVPKSSAEAQLYLQAQQNSASSTSHHPSLRRPLKRKSRFEPNPEGIVKGLPANTNKGPKLNVVEKSKLDWAGYVDKEGMQDELKVAEKAKDGYLSRTDFLGRMEAKREDELKNARSK